MKWLKWSLLGLLFFVVALLCQLPAALVTDKLTLPRGVSLEGVSGSLWSGQVRRLQAHGLTFEQLNWQLLPSRLLLGRLAVEVHAKPGVTKLDGVLGMSLGGKAFADDLSLRAPVAPLLAGVRMPVPSQVGGQLSLQLDEANQGQPWCQVLAGEANWRDARVSNRFGNFELGRIQAVLACDEGAVTAQVKDMPARLGLDLQARLEEGRYRVSGFAKPAADQPKAIKDVFKLMAKPDGSGRYPLNFQGAL